MTRVAPSRMPVLGATAESIVKDFLETSRVDVRALQDALRARDGSDARRQAHRIKGAARIVGADDLARVAEQIEVAASAADGHGAVEWELLEDRAARLASELEHLLEERQ